MTDYPTDAQIDEAVQRGKDLAEPTPARTVMVTVVISDGRAGTSERFQAPLDDDVKVAVMIGKVGAHIAKAAAAE